MFPFDDVIIRWAATDHGLVNSRVVVYKVMKQVTYGKHCKYVYSEKIFKTITWYNTMDGIVDVTRV